MWETPNHPLQTECHVFSDQSLAQLDCLDRAFGTHLVMVSELLDIDINVVGEWGFLHTDRRWGGGKVLHKQHYKVRARGHEKKWLD